MVLVMSRYNPNVEDLRSILSPKTFGAKGDGVTDDTAAVQACFDSATSHSSIFIPDGTYIVSGVKLFGKDHVNIYSNGATLKLKANSNKDVLLMEQCPYSSIVGLKIDGNKGNQTSTVSGIKFKAVYFSFILNCRITDVYGDGLQVIGYFDPVDTSLFRGNDEVHINHCFIQSNSRHAVFIDSVADVNITTCNLEFNGGNGLTVTNTTPIASGNLGVSDNQILSNEGFGIEIDQGSARVLIGFNHIRNNGKSGIRYVGGKQYSITNNNIHLNGRVNVYSAGIILGYNRRGIVSGNMITCTDFSPTQGYGIEAYAVSGLLVNNNIIEDNLSTGIMIDGDCTLVKVSNNIGAADLTKA